MGKLTSTGMWPDNWPHSLAVLWDKLAPRFFFFSYIYRQEEERIN